MSDLKQPSVEIPFAIGATVWHAAARYKTEYPVCPDCAGTKVATMRLGNGDEHALACGLCGVGYEPPTGYLKREVCVHEPVLLTLARVCSFDAEGVEYTDAPLGANGYHIYHSKTLFRDKADCEAACEVLRAAAQAASDTQADWVRGDKKKSMAHSVSYWRGQRSKLRKELEAIERQLGMLKVSP